MNNMDNMRISEPSSVILSKTKLLKKRLKVDAQKMHKHKLKPKGKV